MGQSVDADFVDRRCGRLAQPNSGTLFGVDFRLHQNSLLINLSVRLL
jgi:hypothetical protein